MDVVDKRRSATVDTEQMYRAPALDKGLDILELLSEQSGGMTRGEIVKAMGRSPGEIYRMLERLVARDFVSRSREGDRYALSMKLFVLAHRHPPVQRLVARALPLMDEFAAQAGQSCHLVAPQRGGAVVLAHASAPGNWEFGLRVGAQIDLLTTASGIMMLAYQSPEDRADLLAHWGDDERPKQLSRLAKEIGACRVDGFRVGDSRQIMGIKDITVPLLSPEGYAIAVLTCPYIQRIDDTGAPGLKTVVASMRALGEKLSLT